MRASYSVKRKIDRINILLHPLREIYLFAVTIYLIPLIREAQHEYL